MKKEVKKRFEMINFIISTLGEKGRCVRFDYLRSLVREKFWDKKEDERIFNIRFQSNISLLINSYGLVEQNNTLIDLTDKGIGVYKLENGFYSFIEQKDNTQKIEHLSQKLNLANVPLSLVTICLTVYSLPAKSNISPILTIGLPCFISGFLLKDLLLKGLKKQQSKRS